MAGGCPGIACLVNTRGLSRLGGCVDNLTGFYITNIVLYMCVRSDSITG